MNKKINFLTRNRHKDYNPNTKALIGTIKMGFPNLTGKAQGVRQLTALQL